MTPRAELSFTHALERGHLPAICAIERACFTDPWPESGIEAELMNPYGVYVVALLGGEPVGYVMGCALYEDADVMNVAVLPELRRRGLARAMMRDFLDQCRARGVEHVFLEVRESNEAARRLYESLGFAVTGRRRRYYVKPMEDAIVMAMKLC